MNTRALAFTAAVLLTPIAPALAGDADVPAALFGSEAEAKGDFDTWLGELLDAVAAAPDSPWSGLCLDKVRALMDFASDPSEIEAKLQPVHDRGVRGAEARERIADLLADRARARGEYDRARAYGGNDGYVTRFAVIGPFGWSSAAQVHRRFAPETSPIDPSAAVEGARGPVRWIALPQLGDSPWVAPYEQIRQGGTGVTYSMARLRSDTARTVALKVWCSESFAVSMNGRDAVVADRFGDRLPNPVWTTVRLEAGWNRLLVKTTGRTSFGIKLADPRSGEAVLDVEAGDPLMSEPVPASSGEPEELSFRSDAQRAVAAAEGAGADVLMGTALLLADEGRPWEAYEMFEAAAGAARALPPATQANILAGHGRFLSDFAELPPVQRKLRAKSSYGAALEAFPKHHSATLRMARYENEDDHPDRAVNQLQEYIVENPTPMAWMTVAEIAKARGWEREAIAAAETALGLAPHHRGAIRFLAGYDTRYGNHDAHGKRMERLLGIDASDGTALNALVKSLRDRGRDAEALEQLRELSARWEGSLGYRRQIAMLLRRTGDLDGSLAAWKELEGLVPQEEEYPRQIGEILELQGNSDGAVAAYRRSLTLQGFQPNVWRAITRLTGSKEDFAKRWEPNIDQLIAELPSDEELKELYPKAVALTVLDHSVARVHPDGSSSSIVHMAYKLLNEKGVQKYGDLPNVGELLGIRTILPDGTEMKPTGLRGRSYNMEGLVPGSIIVHRYLGHQRAGSKGYDGGQFFFQDFEFRQQPNPVLLSRWVVISDADDVPTWEKRNYEGDPETVEFDGQVATIWEKRDMPRIEWEQGMPPKEEIVPYVDYSPVPEMDEAGWQLLDGRDDTKSSPILRDALVRAAEGVSGDSETLRALYRFVNAEITGDFGMGGTPASILLEKAGDRGQLFEALVREAGIPYRMGRAMPWRGQGRDMTRPTAQLFSAPFLWLEPRDGAPHAFFMGSRHAPYGIVPEAYRGSDAFLCSESGGAIIRLPAGGADLNNGAAFRIALGEKSEDTRIAGDVTYRGTGGYRFKRQLEEMPQDGRRKFAEGQLSQYFASPTLESYELPGLETRGEPLVVRLSGTMPQYLSRQGDRFVASLGLPATDMTSRYVHRPERVYDLILNVHDDGVDTYEIDLGDAFDVVSLPGDHLAVHALGTYSLTFRRDGQTIRVRRERHLRPARYTPEQYAGFVAWCKGIDDAEQAKIELRAVE
jgi:tetratricopeptide (TPR) repeat protein